MARGGKSSSPFYGLQNMLATEEEEEEAGWGLVRTPKRWWRRGGADLVGRWLSAPGLH